MKALENKADKTLDVLTVFLVGDAKNRVAVDSGLERTSITSDKPEKLVRRIGSNISYTLPLELGTENTAPQPFLRPTLDENLNQIQKFFNNTMLKMQWYQNLKQGFLI